MVDKELEEAGRKARMLDYLQDYVSQHPQDAYALQVEARLRPVVSGGIFSSPVLDEIYREVRQRERKVPTLDALQRLRPLPSKPSLSLDKPLAEALTVTTYGSLTTLLLGGISIVSYSPVFQNHIGKAFDIREEGLEGRLFFNSDFFTRFDILREPEPRSDMRNIAKTFFKVNGENYVGLVQYLLPEGRSAEHHHALDETIVQLAGWSFVELRPVADDASREIIELAPGSITQIPKGHLHVVMAYDEGSITVPLKKTIKRKKDHLTYTMSEGRIAQEFHQMLTGPHYNSGNELLVALSDYYGNLNPLEKERFFTILAVRLQEEKNPNLKFILEQLKTEI